MSKSFLFQQQQQQQQVVVDQENMSNLTSASGEAPSVSSSNHHQQNLQYFAPPEEATQQQQPMKKKRNLPGNPDPEAEVISLSPKTLMATNRFVCEICNKGFQRDQNLQLHRRGHNLPWKLKQRSSKDVIRKKVYVCPEASCVHHDPSRALGDLTGIKKHFCRKHGEKKWKCDKCSKKYAVQSDWKAHSKTCGTREYRCDCGTLFSRRDSFITHRAFCDALAEESARAITTHHHHHHQQQPPPSDLLLSNPHHQIDLQVDHQNQNQNLLNASMLKKEQQSFTMPPWLGAAGPGPPPPPPTTISSSSSRIDHHHHHHQEMIITQDQGQDHDHHQMMVNTNPSPRVGPTLRPAYQPSPPPPSPHMSATALLQKAAQMGSTMSTTTKNNSNQAPHVTADHSAFGLNLSSRDPLHHSALASFVNNHNNNNMVMNMNMSFEEEDPFGAIFNNPSDITNKATHNHEQGQNQPQNRNGFSEAFSQTPCVHSNRDGGGGGEGLTRDFLGLRPLSHSDILSMAGLSTSSQMDHHHRHHQNKNQTQKQQPWQ